ncbi:MAG: hypothetical protein COB35_01295 [Gammaproteobacteria bacterium]|nr:MAG: hypothetical protein COB35_01295 [Gammaproteobacteria bacterium]
MAAPAPEPEKQQTQILVEVFSAESCNRCFTAKQKIIKLIEQLNNENSQQNTTIITYHDVDVVENLDRAVALGILTTPSIVINDQLVYTNMPTMAELAAKLVQIISLKVIQ